MTSGAAAPRRETTPEPAFGWTAGGIARFAGWVDRHPVWTACGVYVVFAALTVFLYRGLWATLYYKDDYHWMSIAGEVARAPWRLVVSDPVNGAAGVRAVQRAVFGLIHSFFGIQAAAYHVVSLALHAANATLVFYLLRRMLRDVDTARGPKLLVSAFSAFVFATTSLHSAAVIWLAAMSTLLVTAALIVLFRFVLAHETRLDRAPVQWGAAALFAFALACKNTAVTFPLVLGVYLLVLSPRRSEGGGRWTLVAVLGGLGLVQLLVTKLYFGKVDLAAAFSDAGSYGLGVNLPLNLLGAFQGMLLSARTYEWLLPGWPFPYVALPLLLAFVAILRSVRFARAALFGLTWIVLMAVPTALFDYRQYSGEQIMASRYYYLPYVGASIALAFVALGLFRSRRAGLWGVVILVVAAAAHLAFHRAVVRGAIEEQDAYGASRMLLYESTLDALKERAPSGSEVFALGWPVPEQYLPHIGEHFFAPRGLTLRGPRAYESLFERPPRDEVVRFVAHWDRASTVLTVRRVPVPEADE